MERRIPDLCELFSHAVHKTPHHVAIEHEEGTLTYSELDSASWALASYLKDLGIGRGSKVPLLTSLGALNIIAILGILKTGACYVPLDGTTWSQDRIDQVVGVIDCHVVVNTTVEPWHVASRREVHLRDVATLQTLQSQTTGTGDTASIHADDLACIIFTSGSTGKPKGVMIRHGSVANYAQTSPFNMDVRPGDRVLHILSVAFDASTGMLFSILGNSGTVMPAAIDTLHEKATTCTILASTPSILATLFIPTVSWTPYKLVHTILVGGETPPQSLLAAWLARSVRILNAYGPTETMCASLMQEVEVCRQTKSIRSAIIGRPMPHCPAYLVDPTSMELIDDDEAEGEIIISGCGLARGYYNDAARTAQAFVDWKGVRVYRTGDMGRWVRGNRGNRVMEFRGRSDRTVKNRGFLVNLESDVERPIAHMDEFGVVNVCATMVQSRLVAVVTPSCVHVPRLLGKLRSMLSAFHVPDRIEAVDELPLSANGKVDVKGVVALLQRTDERHDQERATPEVGRAAGIARCMREALGLSQQHCLTGESDFFELGGNSLAVLKLTTLCRNQGIPLAPRDVYAGKTVAAMTARASGGAGDGSDGEDDSMRAAADQAEAFRLLVVQAMDARPGDVEAAGPLTPLQLELAAPTVECDGKNTVQVRRVYHGTNAAVMRAAWRRVCESEPLFRTELVLHLPCGPVQLVRGHACVLPVQRTFSDGAAYEAAVSQASFAVGLGQRVDLLSHGTAGDEELEMTVVWTVHHALIDGYSQGLVLAQVERAARGEAMAPCGSFIDAAARLAAMHEARADEARSFWAGHLDGVTAATPGVQASGTHQQHGSARAAELPFALAAHDAARIASFAREHGTTVATMHYAAWALAHAAVAGSRMAVVGAVVSGRETQPGFETVVGPTMATLPLVLRLPQHESLTVQRLLDTTMADLARLADFAWSRPDHGSTGWRLTTLLAEQYGFPRDAAEMPQLRPAEVLDNTAFPLNLLAEGDAVFRLVYDDHMHAPAAIHQLRDAFTRALCALLREETVDACLPRSTGSYAARPPGAHAAPQTLKAALERSAVEHADLVAVETMTASLTYSELACRADAVARNIRRRMPNARVVAIHSDGSLNWIVAIFAILKAGCAYCPLDPAYSLERRAAVYTQSGAAGLLLPSRQQTDEIPMPNLNNVIIVDDAENADVSSPQDVNFDRPEEDTICQPDALIVFTSGTTGEPKGVPISNLGLLALQSNREATMFSQPGRRIAQNMSPAFDYCANEILSALLHGGTLVLKDPSDSLAHLKRVDAATFTPSMLAILDPEEYLHLSVVYATGEPVSPALVDRWAPGRLFYNAYGPAECSICTSFTRLTPGSTVTIGRPIRTVRMYILDSEFQPVTKPGVEGEIFLAGKQVMRGYINAPGQSARRILADPWHHGEFMYRTGDYGTYTADGRIFYIGRVDRQVKVRGFRVELAAIEQKLYHVDSSIVQAAALVVNDTLFAFVKPASTNVQHLKRQLEQHLQPTWVPQMIMAIDDMPMTANRKVDSKALEAITAQLKRNLSRPSAFDEDTPRDTVETIVAREWKLVLDLDQETEPSLCEDFLCLGGHSVLQMRLAVRLSKCFGVAVTTGDIIRTPTIRGQANIIRTRSKSTHNSFLPLPENALSPLEVQIWLSHCKAASATTFNIPVLLHLSGTFDRGKLVAALNSILASRKILRSKFVDSASGPIRVLHPTPPQVHEVNNLDICHEINTPFHLERDQLIRVWFHHKSDTLLIVASHAITDLNSIQSLLRGASNMYAGCAAATPRMNYLRAPIWSRRVEVSDTRFWAKYLKEMPPRLETLLRLPDPSPRHVFKGTSRLHSFNGPLIQRLNKLVLAYGVTHHHLAITVVALALQWLTGTNDVLVGCPFQNRFGELEQESAGLFLDRLPVRIKTSAATVTTEHLLRATRDASQQAIAAAIPFREILTAVNLEPNDPCTPCNHPIFQTMVTFHLQNAVESCLAVPGCTVRRASPVDCWASGTKFLFMFEWSEISSDEWCLRVEYDSLRIGDELMERLEQAIFMAMEGISTGESRENILGLLDCSMMDVC